VLSHGKVARTTTSKGGKASLEKAKDLQGQRWDKMPLRGRGNNGEGIATGAGRAGGKAKGAELLTLPLWHCLRLN